MKHKIGTVTLNFDEAGKLLERDFESAMQVNIPREVLNNINSNSVNSIVKESADMALGAFFSKMTELEFEGPRKIISEPAGCVRYAGNQIKTCSFDYFYEN